MPPKQGHKKKKPRVIGDLSDPDGFGIWVRRYLESRRVRNYSKYTIQNAESCLAFFVVWCEARSLLRPIELTKPILERYQHHLYLQKKPDGSRKLSFRSQHVRLTAVKQFFRWLTRENVLPSNPASDLEMPRLPQRLPREVFTTDEVERIMLQPDLSRLVGLRDRAMLEVLYSTGLRRIEVVRLELNDIDEERGTLMVREGKGKKDRMVPISTRALSWIRRYQDGARPKLVVPPESKALFLTILGEGMTASRLAQQVKSYIQSAELKKNGSCHTFRHTMATLMLEGRSGRQVHPRDAWPCEFASDRGVHSSEHPAAQSGARGDASWGEA